MDAKIVDRPGRDRLGEGPVWDEVRGELLWVDIMGHAVQRLHLASGRYHRLDLQEPVGWVLPRREASGMIAGLRSGFAHLDPDSGAVRPIGNPEADRPDNRLNDAKVDAWGRIWAGTKNDVDDRPTGALYRLDPGFAWERFDNGYGVTNGPTFSLDGRIMYHTDSAARTIYAFDLAPDGLVENRRVWLNFEESWGYPDGMTTDAEGCLWIAHWDGGRVSRFSPDAELIRSIALPATNITSCAFGGDNLGRLFVTSSTIGHEDEEHAGALFEVDPGVSGLPTARFAG